jgi:rhodanese-related sulfurtransferase
MHLPGAINHLPCPNSEIAAKRLIELGYTNVKEYREGKQDWFDSGYPVVQEK